MQDTLNLLGHVIGLSALDPETWTCSCGFKGGIAAMGDHISGQINDEIEAKLAEAKAAGLLPLQGA